MALKTENKSTSQQKIESLSSNILELSETDFISVARSNSINDFDVVELRSEAVKYVMNYSLSKGMVPEMISEVVEVPSKGAGGYVKQYIRLLEWDVAQGMLKAQSRSENYGLVPDVLHGNIYAERLQDNNNVNANVLNPNLTAGDHTSDTGSDSKGAPVIDKCSVMSQKHETQLGSAMGDFCKGHRLSLNHYKSLEEAGCPVFSNLQRLAEVGISDHCEDE